MKTRELTLKSSPRLIPRALVPVGLVMLLGASSAPPPVTAPAQEGAGTSAVNWKNDPAWYQGSAEWALYDATRPVEGGERHYEATIFTNKQRMNPETTTKAGDWQKPENIEVFKHNVSEVIPAGNFVYRYLTTAFIRTDDLSPYKLAVSTQEECGTSFKRFVVSDGQVDAISFDYLPDQGEQSATFDASSLLSFQDALSLTLRDYPFDAADKPVLTLDLVPDQTTPRATPLKPDRATVSYIARETITVPYGSVETHHLRVEHARDGRTTQSDYWFAAPDSQNGDMLNVMVKYEGPHGVKYELKRLDWWAYWSEPKPE